MDSPNNANHSSALETAFAGIPAEWMGISEPFPRDCSVLDFLKKQTVARPDGIAVQDNSRSITYRELDLQSNRVANELLRRGLKLEEVVMLLLPATCEFLIAVVGILKAGGTYFPADAELPQKRLDFLLSDSKARFVLSDAGRKIFPQYSEMVLDLAEMLNRGSVEKIDFIPPDANRRVYITYTSGSTGQPKGVEIEHHALINFVQNYHRVFKLSEHDRSSMLAYVAFDASVADIWPVLCAGGTVVTPPDGILTEPDKLIAWLADEEITLTFVSTGLAEVLFTRPWPAQMKLKILVTGGDRLRTRPPVGLPFVVYNGYGPTENTVFSTWSVVAPENGQKIAPPIGRPLINTTAYVLDESGKPAGIGVPGELYVGGEQVARGYLGRPELTRERFLPDPFSAKANAKMYRTGDWARWLPDGEIEFLGRKDGQIQIRGRRVELGEIEGTLFEHAGVQQVCCVPRMDGDMPSGVIAHVVPANRDDALSETLRSHVATRLPDYMVPAKFVFHETFPLTPQGKVDRAALSKWQSSQSKSPAVTGGESGLEQALARLWHSLLPAAKGAPADATFSELGGDSLLAIKLMLGVEEITDRPLETSAFLVQPTFAGLCAAVKARLARTEFQPVLFLRKTGTRPPLFFLYGHTGDIEIYFSLAEALGPDQPVIGIRSPALEDLSRLPKSIEALAAEAIGWIRQIQPRGAPAMAGYSLAGLFAYEIARQLKQSEGVDSFAALLGTSAPMRPTNAVTRLAHFLNYFPAWLWGLLRDRENRRRRLKRWLEMTRETKENLTEAHLPKWDWAVTPVSKHLIGLMESYRPLPKSNVLADLFLEREEFQTVAHPLRAWDTRYLPNGGWNFWTNRPRIHWVEGDHETMIRPPHVYGLAIAVRQAMNRHFNLRDERLSCAK